MAQSFTFLVLSDLHFGSLSVSKDFASEDDCPPGIMSGAVSMKESIIQIAEKENISAILVSGDLTSKGNPKEFLGCLSALNDIADRLSINLKNIIYTYGNHDVDWLISSIPKESSSPILKELYLRIGASVGDIILPYFIFKEKGPVPGCGLVENEVYKIYVMNSGVYCSHDQVYRHGKLGDEQRLWIKGHLERHEETDKWRILLLHHHPFNYCYPFQVEDISCLEEGAFLMDILGHSGIDFVCHGHRHHPILFTEMRTGWVSPVTLLCAGSLAVNEQHRCRGEIPNLFHIVTLKRRLSNGVTVGCVKSYEYSSAVGWQPVRVDHRVPIEAEQMFADVYDLKQRETDFAQTISDCICTSNESFFELPDYQDLPLSLKCMSMQRLNELLKSVLSKQDHTYKILGEYPSPVMVRKQKK